MSSRVLVSQGPSDRTKARVSFSKIVPSVCSRETRSDWSGGTGPARPPSLAPWSGIPAPSAGTVLRSGNLGCLAQEAVLPDLEASPDMTALERVLAARQIGAMLRKIEDTRHKMERLEGLAR